MNLFLTKKINIPALSVVITSMIVQTPSITGVLAIYFSAFDFKQSKAASFAIYNV
jgi:hypothetical protein